MGMNLASDAHCSIASIAELQPLLPDFLSVNQAAETLDGDKGLAPDRRLYDLGALQKFW